MGEVAAPCAGQWSGGTLPLVTLSLLEEEHSQHMRQCVEFACSPETQHDGCPPSLANRRPAGYLRVPPTKASENKRRKEIHTNTKRSEGVFESFLAFSSNTL